MCRVPTRLPPRRPDARPPSQSGDPRTGPPRTSAPAWTWLSWFATDPAGPGRRSVAATSSCRRTSRNWLYPHWRIGLPCVLTFGRNASDPQTSSRNVCRRSLFHQLCRRQCCPARRTGQEEPDVPNWHCPSQVPEYHRHSNGPRVQIRPVGRCRLAEQTSARPSTQRHFDARGRRRARAGVL